LQAGRLCFDDTPQRQFERQQWSEEFSRLRAESKQLRRQHNAAFARWLVTDGTSEGPRAHAEALRLEEAVRDNDTRLRAHVRLRSVRTNPVSRGVSLGTVALAAAVPLAAPAAFASRRLLLRRHRLRKKLCPRCGYDLRATPGRCPECGTIAPAPVAE
jgi:hypothetical protein